MAFIRRVRTASGATAVQIAVYVGGRQQIVKHMGSAHTDTELGILLARARDLLKDPVQGAFALDVQESVPVAKWVPAPALPSLLPPSTAAGGCGSVVRVASGRVTGTASRLVFDVLAGVYADLGFEAVGDRVFRDLVIARVVEPTSLLDAGRVLTDLGVKPASYATLKRTLARAAAGGYRDTAATACFTRALACGDVSLVLYDCTTLYFEAEHEDELRKVGYSKERRVDPQVVVGLLVDRGGFPLEVACFEGNHAETATILPVVRAFQARHQVADMVVVADAGMLSATNLHALDAAQLRFIVGSRASKAPHDLASHFRWHGDAFTDGQVIDTITPRRGGHPGHAGRVRGTGLGNDPKVKAEPVWDPDQHPGSWRAVWAYSQRRAARDGTTLTAQENRARAVVAGERAARTPRFVKTEAGGRSLDEAALARARRLAGLKGYVTNIPVETMSAAEVIGSYHDLWHVEQSFRMSKTDLRARPMFVHTRQAIDAHLTVVFTALALAREVQTRTGLSIRNVIRQLRPLRSATITINGANQTFPPAIPAEKQAILDALTTPDLTH